MSNQIHTCIENFINGNLRDAKRQAQDIGIEELLDALRNDYGMSVTKSQSVAIYLNHPSQATFQAACDAQ